MTDVGYSTYLYLGEVYAHTFMEEQASGLLLTPILINGRHTGMRLPSMRFLIHTL
jgi:hypothetical protein